MSRAAPTLAGALFPAATPSLLRQLVLVIAGVALMTIAAKVKVPFWPVPVTLQTLALPLIAAAYGARLGTATILAWLATGLVAGLPVFANTPPAVAGPLYLLGPTGGYLVAYVAAAWIIGSLAERPAGRSLPVLFLTMLGAGALVLGLGFLWLASFAQLSNGGTGLGFAAAWTAGVVPFLVADLVKTALAAVLIHVGWRAVERLRG